LAIDGRQKKNIHHSHMIAVITIIGETVNTLLIEISKEDLDPQKIEAYLARCLLRIGARSISFRIERAE